MLAKMLKPHRYPLVSRKRDARINGDTIFMTQKSAWNMNQFDHGNSRRSYANTIGPVEQASWMGRSSTPNIGPRSSV